MMGWRPHDGYQVKTSGPLATFLQGGCQRKKRLSALEYVDFNECPLAFGILCDHLCDENVPLSVREFAQIVALKARLPNGGVGALSLIYLARLVVDTPTAPPPR